jgi:precorrin-4/cobalt-precorrin-4 C11-methyltransferase
MTVHFIGAGPGAADLITLRARDLIAASPVCLYAGSLVDPAVLAHCPPGARLVDTARLTLDEIVEQLAAAHTDGQDVARLCSGDPSVFSAVAEQMRRLDAAGIPYDVCPGVSAYAAAAAELNRELTVPGVAQSIVLTRTSENASAMPAGETLATLGAARSTMVVHLSVQRIEAVVAELLPVYGPATPVAVVAWASRPDQVVLRGPLDGIAAQVKEAGVRRAAVIIVGDALAAEGFRDSHLYSVERDRACVS